MLTEAKREANKRYRERNKEKQNEYCKAWQQRNKEHMSEYSKEYYKSNRDERLQYTKEWVKNNPDRVQALRLKHSYGITLSEYHSLLEDQSHKCAICEISLTDMPSKKIHVDHCHDTGIIRGVLCKNCNNGIGMLQEDPVILQRAIQYLSLQRDSNPQSSL